MASTGLIARRAAGLGLAIVLVASARLFGVACVAGGSMRPTLSAGDLIVYRKTDRVTGAGSMAVFAVPSLVVHRVLAVEPDGSLRTRGDANAYADFRAVDPAAVRGEVVSVLPLGKARERVVERFGR